MKTAVGILRTVLVAGLLAGAGPRAEAQETTRVAGTVRDSSGAAIGGASVSLLNALEHAVASSRTDAKGQFSLAPVPRGSYELVVMAAGFTDRRLALTVGATSIEHLEIRLEVQGFEEEVTVTATPGLVSEIQQVSQPVTVIESDRILQRAKAVVAQVATEEVGVHLQRTSPAVAGIYVRGLTGNKVNVYFDGVRYSTGAMRGGINTFLDLIEPSVLEAVEIQRGPNSAQYGSDSLGGSVQFVSRMPSLRTDGPPVGGVFSVHGGSADRSFGTNASLSYSARAVGLLGSVAGRRVNLLRPGEGRDSRAAVTRFFGVPSTRFFGPRLPDTGFSQYGGSFKMNWAMSSRAQIVMQYTRGQQDGGKRYDQLLGGDGNLVADLRNLMLDLYYARINLAGAGWFDQFTATYSINSQREERVNQGGNGDPRAAINHEYERTTAQGVQAYASRQMKRHTIWLGGEMYPERVAAPSFGFDPATGASAPRRPRVPDGSRFTSGGLYGQDVVDLLAGRLRLVGNVRYSAASYRARAEDSPLVDGRRLWPDDSLTVSDVTFRVGAVATLSPTVSVSANLSRGFRAPHITDLGTLGLTGSGFEVAAPDVAHLAATVGSTADSAAVSTNAPVVQVRPETSLTYEAGAHYRSRSVRTDVSFFINDINDNISKQALILPPGAVGLQLGGQPITAQLPNGVVFVGVATNPVLVRTNFDAARIFGIEHSLDLKMGPHWSLGTVATYIRARDRRTGQPPNIEGGTPAPDAYLRLRYAPQGRRFWVEPVVHLAARQSRLSTLDLEDRRTGAARSRTSIRNFFLNGATARGWVDAGADGRLGTADDLLTATGETLAAIQARVLGDAASAPLFSALPGYVTVAIRGGLRIGTKHELIAELENLADRSYRGISWGVDGPGRGVSVRYVTRF